MTTKILNNTFSLNEYPYFGAIDHTKQKKVWYLSP